MPAMITNERAGPIDKTVLLFSAGMDSLCFAHLLKPDVLLVVDSTSQYGYAEQCSLHRLIDMGVIDGAKVAFADKAIDLSHHERDDMIVPNRNAHLVLLASNYGDRIILGSVYGDRSCDKDPAFFIYMEALLNHMWQDQHWTAARKFSVGSPFKDITKTKLVKKYLAAGGSRAALFASYSCYGGAARACGCCKPCFRKRVALENNGVSVHAVVEKSYWAEDFWTTEWFKELLPQIKAGTYRGLEDQDVLTFLARRPETAHLVKGVGIAL